MIRNHLNVAVFCVLMLAMVVPVRADDEGETPEKPEVPKAIADAAGLGQSRPQSPNRAKQINMLKQFEGEVSRSLKLDEDAATDLADIFRDFIDELSEEMEASREEKQETAEIIRELVDEMREAQQDQDIERVQEIREEISELRGEHEGPAEDLDHEALYDQIREILTDEQLEQFEPLADRFTQRLAVPKGPMESKAKLYRKAVNSIDLAEEQRANIRRIFVEASRDAGNPKNRGKANATEEADEALLDSILDELDEDQAREFMNKVEEMERMHRGGRADRGKAGRDNPRDRAPKPKITEEVNDAGGREADEVELSRQEEEGDTEEAEEVEIED